MPYGITQCYKQPNIISINGTLKSTSTMHSNTIYCTSTTPYYWTKHAMQLTVLGQAGRIVKQNWSWPNKRGVALTGRNTTGPPSRAAVACCPWWVTLNMRVLQTPTHDRRRQTPATVT